MFKSLLTNHPLVNILFTVVLAMGALAYFSMPREQDPEINFNSYLNQLDREPPQKIRN